MLFSLWIATGWGVKLLGLSNACRTAKITFKVKLLWPCVRLHNLFYFQRWIEFCSCLNHINEKENLNEKKTLILKIYKVELYCV